MNLMLRLGGTNIRYWQNSGTVLLDRCLLSIIIQDKIYLYLFTRTEASSPRPGITLSMALALKASPLLGKGNAFKFLDQEK